MSVIVSVFMLTYDLQTLKEPLYIALYNAIKSNILNGTLTSGERIPSKRQMATNNGVSVITVENAYDLLLSEGYIFSKPKSGYFVCDISNDFVMSHIKHIQSKIYTLDRPQNDGLKSNLIVDFSNNQTPSDLFPFDNWLKATRKVFSDRRGELLDNSPSQGVLSLRKSIANYLKEYRGLSVDESSIVIGAGSEYLYGLLVQLIGQNVVYGVENPGYQKQEKIYKALGAKVEYLSLDESGVNPKELEYKNIGVLHITPSHQYPTGIIMPISRRYELLAWASLMKGRYIIEDDYDSELRLDGKPIVSLKSIDEEGRVVYLNTFSKALCSTVRISYMVLPPSLAKKFNENLSFYSCTVSTFEQYTLQEFMDSGKMGSHINRLRTYYRKKRDTFIRAIKSSPLCSFVEILGEKAGLFFLMKVASSKDEKSIVALAKERGVGLCTLSSFYRGSSSLWSSSHGSSGRCRGNYSGNFSGSFSENYSMQNVFIMNYATLELNKIDDIVERLCVAFGLRGLI